MRLMGSLLLVLLWAFTSRATGLSIPLEVEQPPTIISHTTSPVIALPFDNTITIRCEATGNPPPIYRWTKDGQDLILPNITTIRADHTDGTLMFHNKHFLQFQGIYRCLASNKLGTAMTGDIKIIVSTPPKFPKEALDPVVVEQGEPIILECNPPQGVPPRQIYWMSIGLRHIEQDERVSMGTNGNLYFSYALHKDSREDYCCFAAFHKIRTIVQKSAMAVVVKSYNDSSESGEASESGGPPVRAPSLLLPSGVQSAKVLLKGEDLQLECIPGGFPTPSVTWMKMGDSLSDRVKLSNFQKLLSIPSVDEKDQGKYMCTAENSAGKAVHYFDVIVREPPTWLAEPPPTQLTVITSDVHIKCSVRGRPPPDITWRRNGELFRDDPETNRRVLDDTLVIHNARPEDSGVYQCEASNSHGSILANVNVMVMNLAPFILTKDFQEYAVILGGDVVMNCSVFSSPPSSISWNKNGTDIEGGRVVGLENRQSLKIISTEKDDSGRYVCVAKNTEGTSSVTAVLDVKDPTKIVSPPQDVQIVSGTSTQLMCVAEYDKSLQDTFEVVWRKNGEEISLTPEENSRYIMEGDMLQIMNVNLDDQGMYTCVAKTSLDEDNASALITVLDVPDAPTRLKISEVKNPRNITLSWEPGSDHNSSVTEFVVEYEETQWEPGRWKELQKVPGNQATAEPALHGHLNYQFRVYAVNAVGPGPPSEPTERYKTPSAAPDRNPENIKIEGHLPHQMDVSWEPLRSIECNGPGLEYKLSYRKLGVEDMWEEQLVRRPSFVVRNTSTFVPYEIRVQSRNSLGWGPEPKTVTGYSGEDVPTAAPRDIGVEVVNTTVLRVSWTPVPPATVRGHLGGYNVHWVKRKSLLNPGKTFNVHNYMSFPGKRSHAIVPGLEPFSEYKLTVNVFNKKGNGPRSDPVTFSTPEGVPGLVPILTASNSHADSVLLVWGPPLEANGVLSGYLLRYHLLNETSLEVIDSREMNITEADITQWHLRGLEGDSLYRFHLSACTRAGCGPPMAQESRTVAAAGVANPSRDFSTERWFIGTMCAVALLTLVALVACFLRKNKGGKYAVKEKEDVNPDTESQEMNDDAFYEYSDSDKKPLRGSSSCSGDDAVGDSVSRDSLVDYADEGGDFNEDGSFIGEYSEFKHRGSVSESSGPGRITA
ncbi:neural cell adhesion molecule L1-like protein isoform X14 [Cololabis saira]|uniref:neural cell adhesion molecule L1-like protein isoform X14 n=1 Tax=Cololabis saira TaxID=129043 RepID=UPI002AD212FD|nr:neural cell adhesion molecule L1-like protein isoform X14 [Cololabis saira]